MKYAGIEISVDDRGWFVAKSDELEFRADTYEKITAQIDRAQRPENKKRKVSLPVIGVLTSSDYAHAQRAGEVFGGGVLTGINRTSRELQIDGLPKGYKLDKVMAATPANETLLRQLAEAEKRFNDLRGTQQQRSIKVGGYGRVDPDEYGGLLERVEAAYAHSKGQKK